MGIEGKGIPSCLAKTHATRIHKPRRQGIEHLMHHSLWSFPVQTHRGMIMNSPRTAPCRGFAATKVRWGRSRGQDAHRCVSPLVAGKSISLTDLGRVGGRPTAPIESLTHGTSRWPSWLCWLGIELRGQTARPAFCGEPGWDCISCRRGLLPCTHVEWPAPDSGAGRTPTLSGELTILGPGPTI